MKPSLILCILIYSFNAFSQDAFSNYYNSFSKKTYDISISAKDTNDFSLYIDAWSLDKLCNKGGILLKSKDYLKFIDAINQAKLKYDEWVITAKENNVKELDKSMVTTSKVGGYFYYGQNWEFQFAVNLTFDFKILESNEELKYLLIVRTGELTSSSNEFMKVKGFVLTFSSSNEINDFLDKISMKKLKDFVSKPKAIDLFKD